MTSKHKAKIRKAVNLALEKECQKWRLTEIVAALEFYKLEPKNTQAQDFVAILGKRLFEFMRDGK